MSRTSHEQANPSRSLEERRQCTLMESKLNVGVIFRAMLGPEDAMAYLLSSRVPAHLVQRVVAHPELCRRLAALQSEAASLRLVE